MIVGQRVAREASFLLHVHHDWSRATPAAHGSKAMLLCHATPDFTLLRLTQRYSKLFHCNY